MHPLTKSLSLLSLAIACSGAQASTYCDQLAARAVNYAPGAPVPLRTIAPRGAMVRLYSAALVDYIHTANQETCNRAIDLQGYVPEAIVGYVDRSPKPGTLPFYAFWKDAPQTDHFYSSSPDEKNYVLSAGWIEQPPADTVNLLAAQLGDSLPLYRTHYFNYATAEAAHHYTRSWPEVQQLQSQGWIFDTIAGYLYRWATPKSSSSSLGLSVPMGRRCEYLPSTLNQRCFPEGEVPTNYRDFQFNQFALVANGAEPFNRYQQKMSFSFTHSGYFKNSQHLAIALRANTVIDTNHIYNSSFYGLGLAIGTFGPDQYGVRRCPVDGHNIAIEAFWPIGNTVLPEGCLPTGPLQEGVTYNVTLAVDDTGTVEYTLTGPGVNLHKIHNAAGWFITKAYPFSPARGGHMLIDSGDTVGGDYDIQISNFKTWWE